MLLVGIPVPWLLQSGEPSQFFSMFDQELRKEFQSILRDGFDEEFIEWCVNEFDSHEFTDNQLPSARLYLPYLKHTMEFLSSEDPVIRSRIESLCAALQSDDECTTENIQKLAKHLEREAGLNGDIPARALSLGVVIYSLGIKKAGFDAGSYMEMFIHSWLSCYF